MGCTQRRFMLAVTVFASAAGTAQANQTLLTGINDGAQIRGLGRLLREYSQLPLHQWGFRFHRRSRGT